VLGGLFIREDCMGKLKKIIINRKLEERGPVV